MDFETGSSGSTTWTRFGEPQAILRYQSESREGHTMRDAPELTNWRFNA